MNSSFPKNEQQIYLSGVRTSQLTTKLYNDNNVGIGLSSGFENANKKITLFLLFIFVDSFLFILPLSYVKDKVSLIGCGKKLFSSLY